MMFDFFEFLSFPLFESSIIKMEPNLSEPYLRLTLIVNPKLASYQIITGSVAYGKLCLRVPLFISF